MPSDHLEGGKVRRIAKLFHAVTGARGRIHWAENGKGNKKKWPPGMEKRFLQDVDRADVVANRSRSASPRAWRCPWRCWRGLCRPPAGLGRSDHVALGSGALAEDRGLNGAQQVELPCSAEDPRDLVARNSQIEG